MEKEEKKKQSHMQRFVFYGDMQDNTENRRLYIRIEKKKKFFCEAANQSAEVCVKGRKCRCYEIISTQIKQTQTIMIMILR